MTCAATSGATPATTGAGPGPSGSRSATPRRATASSRWSRSASPTAASTGVTFRELCSAARANVAAINYHFGDKLGLYTELVEQAIRGMRPSMSLAPQDGTAEERLAAYIRNELERALGSRPASWVARLVNREVDAPTPALDRVVREAIKPRVEYVSRLVAGLMRCPVDDPRVGMAVANINGLPALLRRGAIIERLLPRFRVTPDAIRVMAEATTRFALAGLRELANERLTVKP